VIIQFNPKTMIIFDIDETEIFHLENNLDMSTPKIIPIIGDIKDESKMSSVFEALSPQIVIH